MITTTLAVARLLKGVMTAAEIESLAERLEDFAVEREMTMEDERDPHERRRLLRQSGLAGELAWLLEEEK